MTSSLSPSQFPETLFHGTSHAIQGDRILPGREIGHSHWGDAGEHLGERSDHSAWAADEHLAWGHAIYSGMQTDPSRADQRARVHELHPNDSMQEGQTHSLEDTGHVEYRAPHFEKTGVVHDIMPGRQGTFPNINWRQFTGDNYRASMGPDHPHDANHPRPDPPVERMGQEVPNMHPKSHPTLPLGDIAVKQWDGRVARQSVDDAVNDVRTLTDRPVDYVTPASAVPKHRSRFPNVY